MGLLLTALAVAVRLVWVLVVPTHPVGDFAMYLESARYLCEHHSLDPEFIYMPGYVFLVAGVYALGGGLLAIKMLGVAAGGLATAAVTEARAVFGRGAAALAGLLCALWPAGIAVSSVTGTDMPARRCWWPAVWLLARDAADGRWRAGAVRPRHGARRLCARGRAAVGGAGGAALSRARRALGARRSTRTLAAAAVAFLVLLPWGLRNQLRYGEFFFTDSHGGHTALVGANPNTDGATAARSTACSRRGPATRCSSEPHRESDRAAYALAKHWTAFSPHYALGLLAAKADRLLTHERPLLYWPLYRQSVLHAGQLVRPSPRRGRAARRRLLVPVRRRHRRRDRRRRRRAATGRR